jgi:hypothetical protein
LTLLRAEGRASRMLARAARGGARRRAAPAAQHPDPPPQATVPCQRARADEFPPAHPHTHILHAAGQ